MIVVGFYVDSTATVDNGQQKKRGRKKEVKINAKEPADCVGAVISLVETISTHDVFEREDSIRKNVNYFS